MDFNTFLQIVIAALLGAVAWYFKRESTDTKAWLKQHETSIAKTREEFTNDIISARADAAAQIAQARTDAAEQISKTRMDIAAQIVKVKDDTSADIRRVEQKFEDLRADLPLVYTTREDFIRVTNAIDGKLDKQDAKLDKLLSCIMTGGD